MHKNTPKDWVIAELRRMLELFESGKHDVVRADLATAPGQLFAVHASGWPERTTVMTLTVEIK